MPTVTIHRHQATNQFYDEKLDNKTHLRMMQIPAGTFLMGSPDNEEGRLDNKESPQHRVSVPSFFMAKYPVTQSQWRIVSKMPQVKLKLKQNQSQFKGDTRPVEQVSWHEAIEFCARLTNHTKRQYRLPTEAEWEYACRAGTTTPFHFGETISPELANYDASSAYGDGVTGEYRQETTPVDHFKIANDWGLSDMHGNVLEWCQDHWHSNYEGSPEDGSAWLTDKSDANRVIRGGSWNYVPRFCRSASRVGNSPDVRDNNLGFRVSCSAPATL
ncbi:formylglycine-generating enzyme family protein [Phormidium tenue]|uniref:Formylglycine-generating enzyme family protein n=1 Tax=Phormidium tenue FACHB-1050 TaxID=2692857 RepID=A0ABR8CGL6_9CYAN|nr:formylglycine-generating enzyme family protein [Phormidium tenue]MBD2319461.1 formylglycine-generating enzyme family protein [Phormidium tenue FACHB-1050]